MHRTLSFFATWVVIIRIIVYYMKASAKRIILPTIACILLAWCSLLNAADEKPNIVILLADDMGWADVGYHGSPIMTPNIDRLASEGTRLERFYVCPVCTPTRAGLMTGRYPIRFGLMKAVISPWRNYAMDEAEQLMPEILAKAGYKHRGIFGKWHLGNIHVKFTPTRRGFTEFIGHYNGAIDYFTHIREGELDWHRNLDTNYDEGYSTDLIAEAASKFIIQHADDGPFLCYVPFNAPHSPFQAKDKDIDRYRHLPELPGNNTNRKIRPTYAAMVDSMDQGIGNILKAIDDAGISENTLVWFMSDNGGTAQAGDNFPLRGQKGQVFEGGIRVPAVVRWPGKIEAGAITNASLAWIDVLPTLMDIVGMEESAPKPLDGISARDLLVGNTYSLDRDVFNYIGQQGEEVEEIALISAQWKLVVLGPNINNLALDNSKRQKFLFRIDVDQNETTNLAQLYPDRVNAMYKRLVNFHSLQPSNAIAPYREGRDSFKGAPEEWKAPGN